jgi:RNA polymerase sigma-70 factor (ECF subfamily)
MLPPPPHPASPQFLQILDQARQGSREALGSLIDSFRDYLLFLARRGVCDVLRVKTSDSDLVQEATLVAVEELPLFRGKSEEEFRAWLREILHGVIRSFKRTYQLCQKRDVSREQPLPDADTPEGQTLTGGPSPVTELSRKERMRAFLAAVAKLPERYRYALNLRHKEKQSYREIGIALGISEEAARKLCIRALDQMGDYLKSAGVIET